MNFKNVEQIKWKKLGKLFKPMKVWGKITNQFRCPICRTEMIVYHSGKKYKICCEKCGYIRYDESIFKDNVNKNIEEAFRLLK